MFADISFTMLIC